MRTTHTLFAGLLVTALVGCSAPMVAPPSEAKASVEQAQSNYYTKLVDFDFMKELVSIPPKAGVVIVDARPGRLYDPGHIPGAISIPDSQFDKLASKLPADKNTALLFYCEGPKCVLSHQSAYRAEKLGYTNVKVFPGGFPEWSAKGMTVSVSTAQVKKLLDEKANVVLVDARPARVFAKGSIPTAISVPDSQFEEKAALLPADKSTPLVFFCGGLQCVLSDQAAAKAVALGYTNVKTYPEGEPEWTKVFGDAAAAAVAVAAPAPAAKSAAGIEPGKEKGSISVASFERIMKNQPSAIVVVDVRSPKEFAVATIKGAINVPIDDFEAGLAKLPKDKPIVFVCATGGRSGEAYDTAKILREELNVWFLDAQVTYHADGTFLAQAK